MSAKRVARFKALRESIANETGLEPGSALVAQIATTTLASESLTAALLDETAADPRHQCQFGRRFSAVLHRCPPLTSGTIEKSPSIYG
jgi:hypothetical protein